MKSCLFISLFFFSFLGTHAQNAVYNGDFEKYSSCPASSGELIKCTGWQPYNTGTSDYYNACASSTSYVSVPANGVGYQMAASGDGYAGIVTFVGETVNYKEYLKTTIPRLTIGELYEVSMSVSLADVSKVGSGDLGVWFYDAGPITPVPGSGYINITPQVSYASYSPIIDTMHWTRIVKSFYADSGYKNMVIGGFASPAKTPIALVDKSYTTGAAYYYIDSVVVRKTNISYSFTDTAFCSGDSIRVPFMVNKFNFNSSNVFSLQLSDAYGSFASPLILGTIAGNQDSIFRCVIPSSVSTGMGYRLRILSTNVADTTYESSPISIGNVRPSKPIASTNYPICELDTVKLFATDTTKGIVYRWSGPGDFLSEVQNPFRTPAAIDHNGKYIVSVWLNGCATRDTVTVNIIPTTGHLSAFSNSPVTAPICEYDTLKLTGTLNVAGITDIKWSMFTSAGVIAHTKDTSFVYFTPGQYILVLSGKDGLCFARSSINVLVKPMPPRFKVGGNTPVCEMDALNLTAARTIGGVSFAWKGASGFTSTTQNPVFDPVLMAQNGKYICVAALNGCYASDSIDIEVRPTVGLITNQSNSPVCEGDTLKLSGSAHAGNNAGFLWVGPGGILTQAQDTIIAHAGKDVAGKYILFGSFNSCSASDTLEVVIRPKPDTFIASSNSPVCKGDTLKLVAGTGHSLFTFTWKGPAGFTSSTQDAVIARVPLSASGTYVLAGHYDGCSITDTVQVRIKPAPDGLQAFSNAPLCTGDVLKLDAVTSSSGCSFSWSGPQGFGSLLQNTQLSNVQLADTGIYKLIATLDGCTDSAVTQTVMVTPLPQVPDISSNSPLKTGDVLMLKVNNIVSSVRYQWSGPAGFSSAATDPSLNDVTRTNEGIYVVTATENGCASSDSLTVVIASDSSYLVVYPNASNGNFTISGTVLRDQEVPINITAGNGQLVYEARIKTDHKKLFANMLLRDALASGVYTLRLAIDGKIHSVRLSIVRQ